jgi:surface carbohydrate biosynthesis protein
VFIKLIKFFLIIIKSKKFLRKPKKSEVIFIGKPAFQFSLFSKEPFPKLVANDNNTIGVWREYFNLYVIIKCLFKFKFSFLEYCEEYINLVKPKLIITFLDNYDLIYKLKAKNSKKIVIQNSYRYGSNFLDFKSKGIERVSIDHTFVYNQNIGNLFNKYLNTNTHSIGSFLLNSLNLEENSEIKYKYLYVSTYRRVEDDKCKISPFTTYNKFQEQEKKLVKILFQYFLDSNQTLNILGGNKFSYEEEYNYFKDIIRKDNNWNFIKPKKRHYSFAYNCINSSEIIIGIDSSLLYESLALGKKTIFFNCRVMDDYLEKNRHFGWPKKFNSDGVFWTNNLSLDSVSSKISKVEKLSKEEWIDSIKEHKPQLIDFDKNNKIFCEKILKIF